MRAKWVASAAIVLGSLGLVLRLHPQASPSPSSPIPSPAARSFAILFGVGGSGPLYWNGSVSVNGAKTLNVQGWRFDEPDGTTLTPNGFDFAFQTRQSPKATSTSPVSLEENGLIITVADNGSPVTFNVSYCALVSPTLPQCLHNSTFTFSSAQAPFGTALSFSNGTVLVYQVPSPLQLTSTQHEEDYPSMAQSGDDVYLAYTRFVHGDPKLAQPLQIKNKAALPNFDILARATGGDQVLMLHYSKSKRVWTGPFPITSTGEDVMRTAVAVDGKGLAWVFYSTQRPGNFGSGNFDLFAKSVTATGATSGEVQITSDPGPDLWPVAATDSCGQVWVAWQGFRGGNLEILAASLQGNAFSTEVAVSTSQRSNWDPAIAASSNGDVTIAWDTYDKGDYDVYVRRVGQLVQGKCVPKMDAPIAVATTANFEARASIVYDAANALWIAYEVSGPQWGKDYGAYDTSGTPIYQNHTIEVRFIVGTTVYAPSDDVARVLPGPPGTQMFPVCSGPDMTSGTPPLTTCTKVPPLTQPDPQIAIRRLVNQGVLHGGGLANSFPRLATDGNTIYLAYRVFNGLGLSTSAATGESVGSIWSEQMVYFDNSLWHGPGVFADADGLLDNRPAMVPLAPGRMLIAQAMDHRLTPLKEGTPQMDGVNSDIYALELQVQTGLSPSAPAHGSPVPASPGVPSPAATAEAQSAAFLANYRTSLNGQTMQLMRGDFHRHTELSFDGHADGPLVDAYRYGIDAASMNWYSCCDHDNGGAREYSWWLAQKYTDAYLLGTSFVPVFYYERSLVYPGGHRNIMFEKRGIRPLPRLPLDKDSTTSQADTRWLYSYLKFFSNGTYNNRGRTAAHTSATSQGNNWGDNDIFMEPMVEIYQGDRQSYEACPQLKGKEDRCKGLPAMFDPPRSNSEDDSISGYQEQGYISNALKTKGYKLGFEASSDHVSTHISFTNLWVTAPTRAGILDAVSLRHTYASTDYILADFRSGNYFMGDMFTTSSQPVFSITLQGTSAFKDVSIVKDNTIVYSASKPKSFSLTWQDSAPVQPGTTSYYYVRGLQEKATDQARGEAVWVSPIWVTFK